MSTPVFSPRAVAALFLARQHLERPRARKLTAGGLARFAADCGGVQLDSINVVARAHHLTVWSRFGVYDRAALERLLYQRRVLFEYWAHAACLVPTAHFPAWRRAMLDYRHRHKGWTGFLRKHPRLMRAVESAIAARGPLANADFQAARPPGAAGWWNWKPATHALDFLWMSGRIAVHSRTHFQKRFDLLERVLPEALAQAALDRDAFRHWHLTRSLHAMGAATETDLRLYLTYPKLTAAERATTLRAALRRGEVVQIEVAGARTAWYALARDLDALAAAGRRRAASRGATLLAPFDSLLWHRDRVARLFGFDYRIEVYVPAARRTVGYYALPLLVDGQLIGRVDAKLHRAEHRLELRHVHFEPWFARGDAPPAASWGPLSIERGLTGLADSAASLAAFCGAHRIDVGRVSPASLRARVRSAVLSQGE
ncbi:MAG: crosslink repair DNA glycosylase YcaQ family protein [Deltaproteobacteria bacterium]|nr:crosslink repair DNA glycosylase YcaQ family protein [Deltaproteobacteria bacterium]